MSEEPNTSPTLLINEISYEEDVGSSDSEGYDSYDDDELYLNATDKEKFKQNDIYYWDRLYHESRKSFELRRAHRDLHPQVWKKPEWKPYIINNGLMLQTTPDMAVPIEPCYTNYHKHIYGVSLLSLPTKVPTSWISHKGCTTCDTTLKYFEANKKPASKLKANPNTQYAFTLTMPPSYKPKKPIDVQARAIMEHGLTNKPYERPIKWAYVVEHTEAGTPHIHGVYQTPSGRRISAKYFKRYWDLWDEDTKLGQGHKGGYHAKARHNESYDAYMSKEGNVIHSDDPCLIQPEEDKE